MIQLSNGATVHAAFILPASPGMKPNGVVLAEQERDWVTWSIYWDGETTGDAEGQTHELWECETGCYFQKMYSGINGEGKRLAELSFGFRLGALLNSNMKQRIGE